MPKPAPGTVDLSAVVPVHNGAAALGELHRRLTTVLDSVAERHEIILVDDKSTDDTWHVIDDLAQRDPRTIGIQLSRNVGQGNATIIGLSRATGALAVTLDDDLQHLPEEIPKLLAALEAKPELDVIYSRPIVRNQVWWRRIISWTLNLVASAALLKNPFLRFSAFRVLRRPAIDWLIRQRERHPPVSALLLRFTRRIGFVPTAHASSAHERSRYTWHRLALVWVGYFQALGLRHRWLLGAISAIIGALCVGRAVAALAAVPYGGEAAWLFAVWVAGFVLTALIAFGALTAAWQSHLGRNDPPLEDAGQTEVRMAERGTA